jgi:hypothetical protein
MAQIERQGENMARIMLQQQGMELWRLIWRENSAAAYSQVELG